MKGSEKQVAWAMDIIASAKNALECMERNAVRFESQGMIEDTLHYDMADVAAVRRAFEDQLKSIDDANAIIRARQNLTQQKFEELAKSHHKYGR